MQALVRGGRENTFLGWSKVGHVIRRALCAAFFNPSTKWKMFLKKKKRKKEKRRKKRKNRERNRIKEIPFSQIPRSLSFFGRNSHVHNWLTGFIPPRGPIDFLVQIGNICKRGQKELSHLVCRDALVCKLNNSWEFLNKFRRKGKKKKKKKKSEKNLDQG